MKITLYHGSYVSVVEPLVNVGRRELDFCLRFIGTETIMKGGGQK